jgi:hypothetical protein
MLCGGPSVSAAFQTSPRELEASLRGAGIAHSRYYRDHACLPFALAKQHPGLAARLGAGDWLSVRGGRHRLPAVIRVDGDLAWFLGLYAAGGSRSRAQITVAHADEEILNEAQDVLARLNLPVCRTHGAMTCRSALLAHVVDWLGMGGHARDKRIPYPLLGWPKELLASFLEGIVDGDGSRESTQNSLWTSSEKLVGDLLLVCARLGKRAGATVRERKGHKFWQISVPHRENELLAEVPICDRLLVDIRRQAGLTQAAAVRAASFKHATKLDNIERRGCNATRLATLRRLRDTYAVAVARPPSAYKLDRLVEGGLRWDAVVSVEDTGEAEPVFDLEVRPLGRTTENFLAGHGGVFVSNTAGFVDAGFSGQLTLELSNVANLPIAIYPGMLVGQLCVFQMTSPAERPYGSEKMGSKYQAQRGPTPSRFFENFRRSRDE